MHAARRPPTAPEQPLARGGSRRVRLRRRPLLSGAPRMRPANSRAPARWAPTRHLEHVAWRMSVPLESRLTRYLSNVVVAATMESCILDTFGYLSCASSELRLSSSVGALAVAMHWECLASNRSRSENPLRPSKWAGSAGPTISTDRRG